MNAFMKKEGTKSLFASLISIAVGMLVGALIVLIVGLVTPNMGIGNAW